MHLRILGCSGGYPTADSPSSGYLIEDGDTRIWLDAGNGTFSVLQRYADYTRIDALVLSHLHPDHCLDIYPLNVALRYGPVKARIAVYAPPRTQEILDRLMTGDPDDKLGATFDFHEVDAGQTVEVGGVRLSFLRTDHPGHTLAVRADSASGSLTYSADNGPGVDLAPFACGTDLFLCEATYQSALQGAPVHLTAQQAAEAAVRAGARQLILTHLWPPFDSQVSLEEARAAAGDIPVRLARPGERFET
ncbi:MAG TPA: MBL fold metallo-hydrolase [Thermoanaerobaculia bacterium]|nr:MBL fold metallo-hydrolase [Thermoanaerobaculia bacterium]